MTAASEPAASASGRAGTAPIVVAVDGPAGSGKSSVSKAVAAELGYGFLDTGAAYRALAWFVTRRGLQPADPAQVIDCLPDFDYAASTDPTDLTVRVGDDDVTEAIRQPEISAQVSSVARIPEVRQHLTDWFRHTMAHIDAPGIVVEGRDITTVVAPDAPVRILLTADDAVRAQRRSAEIPTQSVSDTARHMARRDAADLTVVDFMTAAEGVTTVDSTHLNFAETVQAVIRVIHDRTLRTP